VYVDAMKRDAVNANPEIDTQSGSKPP